MRRKQLKLGLNISSLIILALSLLLTHVLTIQAIIFALSINTIPRFFISAPTKKGVH